ncbi:MAG: beta-hydroxyacyl-ACP dehydratase [Phycisphaerae bacterium]|nr:beta-hydroxyacyl-ACP dehydratase [Phycisphaerae bacterium]
MPSELLFDISGIDMSGVAASREEVGRILLQTGDMRHLDFVVWQDATLACGLGVKDVRADEFWVKGHIPGRPLLPGVLMIEAGAQLCSFLQQQKSVFDGFLAFTRCDDCVFRGQVVPGDRLVLLAKEVEAGRRRFVSRTQGLVDGKLVFEATITGMRI